MYRDRPQYRLLITAVLVVLAAVFFTACQQVELTPTEDVLPTETPLFQPPPVPVEQLYENPWILVAYGDPDNPTVIPAGIQVSAQFDQEGNLGGFSGCNQYSTGFEASSDGSMAVQEQIITTMMVCPETESQVEQAYLSVLPTVDRFGFSPEGRLEFGYPMQDGETGKLVFVVGEVPLNGTSWTLESYGDPDALQSVPAGMLITADFGTDGTLTGKSACNSYTTEFSADDGQLSIQPIATTMMACPTGMEQEQAYLDLLSTAQTYQIVGTQLTITSEDGQVLVYTSANLPLETTQWTLVAVDGQSLPTAAPVTLFLTPEDQEGQGTAGGTAGCNQYSTAYEHDGVNLSFSEIITTRMMCEEQAMDLEGAYLEALSTSQSFRVVGATLVLNSAKGVLTFAADRTPLTGALWVLRSIGDIEDPQTPVTGSNFTAQFTRYAAAPTGVVAGTTGCNEYAAPYTASLTEIKINIPDSTENSTCAPGLLDQEQLYFLALNNATQYRILGNTLVIPYDDGRQALVFVGTQIGLALRRPLVELEGLEWYLWTIDDQPILNGTTITAEFTVNPDGSTGTMNGSAGCNRYEAAFSDNLGMETTLKSSDVCASPRGVMNQEQAYLEALSRAYGYWFTGDQLIINSGSGVLTYHTTPAPQSSDQLHLLQQETWYLVSYNTSLSAPGAKGDPNVNFNQDGTLVGYTGCNSLSGRYTTELNRITISDLSLEQAACPNQVLAAQERTLADVLNTAQTYQVVDHSMQIVGSSGVLNFYFAPVNSPEDAVPPKAVITAPSQVKVGELVVFDASRSTSQVPVIDYSWDFGDGSKGRGVRIEHVYDRSGTYFVQMTVTDARNFRNSSSMNIEVLPLVEPTAPPTPAPTQPPEPTPEPTRPPESTEQPTQPPPTPEPTQPPMETPPRAIIEGPTSGYPGEAVSFSAAVSQPGSSPIISYAWNFGDGTSIEPGDQSQVSKIFNQSGIYDVTVVVTDQNGLSDSATLQIAVNARLDTDVWLLNELGGEPLVPGTTITLQFLEGEVAGFAGCNTYTGNYTSEQNEDGTYTVRIENLESTRIGCPDSIMQQEALYLLQLGSVQVAGVDGNILLLGYPEGTAPDGQPYPAGELEFYELGTPAPY